MGETSADELALKSGEDSDKAKGIDILRSSPLTQSYENEKQLAADVALYEKEIIDKFHKLDVYRAKNKSRSKISFTDLTLTENLNYIKYNLKNSDEAFELFKITQDKYSNNPELAASIIQKLANRSNLKLKDVGTKLIPRQEYFNMLKSVQKNLELLDNKQAVDTLYSVARLHKGTKFADLQKDNINFAKYITYFIKDMLKDQSERIPELSSIQVAYLTKGLTNLKKMLNDSNKDYELVLRENIKQHAILNKDTYDPYSISKVLRYLYSYNDGSESSVQVF